MTSGLQHALQHAVFKPAGAAKVPASAGMPGAPRQRVKIWSNSSGMNSYAVRPGIGSAGAAGWRWFCNRNVISESGLGMQREMPKRRNWAVIALMGLGFALTTLSVAVNAYRDSEATVGDLL
jgi:hypothetical protein